LGFTASFARAHREDRPVDLRHDLDHAMMIAQVDEDEIAMIALAMDPSRDADGLSGMGGAQRAASVSAIGVHLFRPLIQVPMLRGSVMNDKGFRAS
jgi:hypothetical protein